MWCGLLKQIIDSDIHIILDNVKASKNSRYNRNLVGGQGEKDWLTIPYTNFSRNKNINQLKLNTSEKIRKNIHSKINSGIRKHLHLRKWQQSTDFYSMKISMKKCR